MTLKGVSAAPDITVSPFLLDYGDVALGTKSRRSSCVPVKNDGTAALVLDDHRGQRRQPDQFKVVVANNLCAGRTLAAGQSAR